MQTKISIEKSAHETQAACKDRSLQKRGYLPFVLLAGMIGAILFLDAVLPLGGFWFHTALLPQVGSWTLLPTHLHIYWNTQPSAYGPVWVGISCLLQWLVLPFGVQTLLPLLMALRLFGLVAHLCSTLLIWSISGHIQRQQGQRDLQKRILATFAFAWNPLLLLEACVNAHNDVALLLLILLAIWLLVSQEQLTRRSSIMAVAVFALATCLKLNAVVLMPFVLIFLWKWGSGRLDNNRGEQGSG